MSADPSLTVASERGTAITIRGISPELKARLRVRAAHNARSMEAKARLILEAALAESGESTMDLVSFAHSLFAPLGGVDLELPARELARDPPDFGGSDDQAAPDLPNCRPHRAVRAMRAGHQRRI